MQRKHFSQLTTLQKEAILTHQTEPLYLLEGGNVAKYAFPAENGKHEYIQVTLLNDLDISTQ